MNEWMNGIMRKLRFSVLEWIYHHFNFTWCCNEFQCNEKIVNLNATASIKSIYKLTLYLSAKLHRISGEDIACLSYRVVNEFNISIENVASHVLN